MMNTLPDCCNFVVPLRAFGGTYPAGTRVLAFVRWIPVEGTHYHPSPLTPASFGTGPSDHDMPSDELYCPCGATLDWPDQLLGTAIEIADDHIEQTHPDATAKARAKRRREAAKR